MYDVCFIMFVQRFEPPGRRFTRLLLLLLTTEEQGEVEDGDQDAGHAGEFIHDPDHFQVPRGLTICR